LWFAKCKSPSWDGMLFIWVSNLYFA
jgi:hypothetical protein